MKPRLLLHTCCAPCSTHCVKEMLDQYDITMYFYNPNIHPYGE
ncbi:MAG: epoxyqueuosine reductase QueH, partial [Candidatus Woesearchaeota archaeon]